MSEVFDHDRIRELLSVHALDATDANEADIVEAHVAECAECRDELDAHRAIAGLIGSGNEDPAPEVWDRIHQQISAPAEDVVVPLAGVRRSNSVRTLPRLAIAAVIVLLAGVAGLTVTAVNQRRQLDATNAQIAELQRGATLRDAASAAASKPGTQQIALRNQAGSAVFTVVVAADGTAFVIPDPSAQSVGDGDTYQLWGVHGHDAVSLGLLGGRPGVQAIQVPAGIEALAVTVEKNPGVVTSHNKPVAQATI